MCRTLHLALLSLMRFPQAHLSGLSRSLWIPSRPSGVSTVPFSLVSSANLLRVHSILLSHWLKYEKTPVPVRTSEVHHLSPVSFWTSSHWPLPSGCDHQTIFLVAKQSTHQTHISPNEREGCCGGLCQRLYRHPDRQHSSSFLVHWCSHTIIESS